MSDSGTGRILAPPRSCWRVEHASRVAFLIDGQAYLSAFRAALGRARRSILIVGWDIDSRLELVRDHPQDGMPTALGPFLNAVVSARRRLHAHVLVWDFAMIYALERELLPLYKLEWRTHRRLHFRMNDRHPPGASQHEKIVVVDDTLAFVGGFDLGKWRWDSSEHRADDPRRVDPEGKPYPPFHDVQMMVEGEVAAALGERVRVLWQRATGEEIEPPGPTRGTPWPAHVTADLEDVQVAVARTEPAYAGRPEVREVERLHLEAIAAASGSIYIENQYLTSSVIRDALAARLEEPGGPEVVLVLPLRTGGWLEQTTMDVLRARLLRRLREADRHGRLRVYYPGIPGLGEDRCLSVHAKLLIVDDRLVKIGSANTSNRSMGLDTECDLAIESGGDPRTARAIAGLRERLLAEHLGVGTGQVARAVEGKGSLIAALESLRRGAGERTLHELEGSVPEALDREVPDAAIIDPERPLAPERLVEHVVAEEERMPVRRQILSGLAILAVLLALAASWRFTPLGEWLDAARIAQWAGFLREQPAGPLLAAGGYVLGGLLSFPVTVLIVGTALVFGPVLGFLYAMLGCLLSAAVTYGIGRGLGRNTVRRVSGERINRLSRRLARRGVTTMATLRLFPIAPFTVVNVVAGASHIAFADYLLGTGLGMIPGTLALTVFADRLQSALLHPGPATLALLAAVVVVIAAGILLLNRWLRRRRDGRNGPRRQETA